MGPHDRGLLRPGDIHPAVPRGGLEHAPVKLLKWTRMEKRADRLRSATTDEERALALPRRQDLGDEPDAFYSAEEVRELETYHSSAIELTQLPIVSVSHAWETSVHWTRVAPLLVDVIKRADDEKTAIGPAQLPPSSLAVFFDLLSAIRRCLRRARRPRRRKRARSATRSSPLSRRRRPSTVARPTIRAGAGGGPPLQSRPRQYGGVVRAGTTVVLLTETPEGSSALAYL